jgi:superfamily II RNA helicase
MAGRAGRRGIDTVGHVVHCNNLFDMPSLVDYKTVLNGQPQKLVSKYHISYSGILTQLRDTTTTTPVNRITVGDIESFVQKSMLASELNHRQKSQESILAVLSQEYEKKKAQFESNVAVQEKCKQFVQCKDTLKIDFLSQKKRKEVEKELS